MENSSSESQPENSSHIGQNNSGSMFGGMQAAEGDGNFQYQDYSEKNFNFIFDFSEAPTKPQLPQQVVFKSWRHRLYNYFKLLLILILISVFVAWFFMGLFANNAFPQPLVSQLIEYSFSGLISFGTSNNKYNQDSWMKIHEMVDLLIALPDIKVSGSVKEAEHLSRRDSSYWLLAQILEIFEDNILEPSELFWQIRDLEDLREPVSNRLKPLKAKHLRNIQKIQSFAKKVKIVSEKSKRQDQLEKALFNLVQKYISTQNPSEVDILSLISDFKEELPKISGTNALYNFYKIINWVHAHSHNKPSSTYEEINRKYPLIRARKSNPSNKYHTNSYCKSYPKIEKEEEDVPKIDFYYSTIEAEQKNREICSNCLKMNNLNPE